MNNIKAILFLFVVIFLTTFSCGQKKDSISVMDYLNTGKEIIFNNVNYKLAWSSNPSDNFYKQEYIGEGDSLEKFKEMLLIDAVTGKSKLKDVVDAKVADIKKRKETDPMVNYELFEKDGEVMLDFILSYTIPGGNDPEFVERNVYRYKTFKDSKGEEGVLMFGVSNRAYENDIDNFLISLKENRFALPNAVGSFTIPEITVNKNNK